MLKLVSKRIISLLAQEKSQNTLLFVETKTTHYRPIYLLCIWLLLVPIYWTPTHISRPQPEHIAFRIKKTSTAITQKCCIVAKVKHKYYTLQSTFSKRIGERARGFSRNSTATYASVIIVGCHLLDASHIEVVHRSLKSAIYEGVIPGYSLRGDVMLTHTVCWIGTYQWWKG